jgi:hypothetical protein
MDRTRVSEALNPGSIPGGATFKKIHARRKIVQNIKPILPKQFFIPITVLNPSSMKYLYVLTFISFGFTLVEPPKMDKSTIDFFTKTMNYAPLQEDFLFISKNGNLQRRLPEIPRLDIQKPRSASISSKSTRYTCLESLA